MIERFYMVHVSYDEMLSLQLMINQLCGIINGMDDPVITRRFQRGLSITFPQVLWAIHEKTGKLSGTLI